ncbi:MAG: FecCD family ABC transporter permease [Thermoanaerobaculia bacterium]
MRGDSSRVMLRAAATLAGVLLLVSIAAVLSGAEPISIRRFLSPDAAATTIIFGIRLPRIALAAAAGAVLAVSGLTFQTMLRNPLADPFILGVSGGAAAGAAIATALGMARNPVAVPVMAFGGSILATAAVFLLARRRATVEPARLILAGLVLNAFFTAIILIALSVARGADLTAALRWMMGSFFSATWGSAIFVVVILVVSLVLLAVIAGDVRMMIFGEEDAKARGVETERIKLVAFLTAAVATGAAVSASGIIGFVGLLVPQAIRALWPRDYRVLLPLSALGGAILLVAADTVARVAIAPAELPIGALTALLGVPFFLVLLRRF